MILKIFFAITDYWKGAIKVIVASTYASATFKTTIKLENDLQSFNFLTYNVHER